MANSREARLRNRIAEAAMEGSALAQLMRAVYAPLWDAAKTVGDPAILAECVEVAPDIEEVERHTKRIAALAERLRGIA